MIGIAIGLSIRLDKNSLAVIGGALAFAVGFALRDLVASFIAGITIMFDRPFQVGDRVAYGGEYGDILTIGLRSVRMNTLDHNIITIPNNKVFTDVTSSANYGALEMQVAMDFYIGADQNATLAMEIIREACFMSPYAFLDQPHPRPGQAGNPQRLRRGASQGAPLRLRLQIREAFRDRCAPAGARRFSKTWDPSAHGFPSHGRRLRRHRRLAWPAWVVTAIELAAPGSTSVCASSRGVRAGSCVNGR
jgi:small-conductance mechanosensitive channel